MFLFLKSGKVETRWARLCGRIASLPRPVRPGAACLAEAWIKHLLELVGPIRNPFKVLNLLVAGQQDLATGRKLLGARPLLFNLELRCHIFFNRSVVCGTWLTSDLTFCMCQSNVCRTGDWWSVARLWEGARAQISRLYLCNSSEAVLNEFYREKHTTRSRGGKCKLSQKNGSNEAIYLGKYIKSTPL